MISTRLNEIVNLIDQDQNVADIGSDHGYVLIELRKRGFKSKLLGVENKKAPFLHLVNNVNAYKDINITCDLSDGIENVSDEYHTVIIAGMGFQTISYIISKNKEKLDFIDTFIIDAHTDKSKVRAYFVKLGYKIQNETIVFEDGIFYDLIKFTKTKKEVFYDDCELEFGPIHIKNKDKLFVKMIQTEIDYNKSIIEKIANTNAKDKINKLTNRNIYLENLIE